MREQQNIEKEKRDRKKKQTHKKHLVGNDRR